jgi:hypothetical protein
MNLSLLVGDPIFGRMHDGGDGEELEFSLFVCDPIGRMLDMLDGEELAATLSTVMQTGEAKGGDDTMFVSISLLLAASTML